MFELKHKIKEVFANFKRKAMVPVVGVSSAVMLSVPAFAADGDTVANADGVIDPALFDPLVNGVTGNISAVLPKILIVVGVIVGIGVVITLFKRHARGN